MNDTCSCGLFGLLKMSCTSVNRNRIGGVMDSVLASSEVDRGFEPSQVKPKTMKSVCVASPLSTQQ